MKAFNKLILTISGLFPAAVFAAETKARQFPELTFDHVMIGVIVILGIVLILLMFVLRKLSQILRYEKEGAKPIAEKSDRTFWQRVMSLKPLSAEKDLEMEHEYDGIKELNNPVPAWFNLLFYTTVVAAFVYMIYYHVIGTGNIMEEEYQAEMIQAEEQKQKYLEVAGNVIDESNVTMVTEEKRLAEAKALFTEKCQACHGNKGQGTQIAPNLTDLYWLHGGKVGDIFKTIKYGVPDKGMISWQSQLKPEQIQNLASFIISIRGTVPENEGKAPQGEKLTEVSDDKTGSKEGKGI